jgi:hypothetical protein
MIPRALVIIAAVALGGCSLASKPPPPVVKVETIKPPPPPNECNPASDPDWQDPPAREQRLSDLARVHAANSRSFEELRRRRSVCAAGLGGLEGGHPFT